jgi:translin
MTKSEICCSRLNYGSVESSLRVASKKFDLITSRRERLIKESREIISLSAKTIISIHTANFQQAQDLSKQAKKRLQELRKVAGTDLVRYILMPEQEFVESSVMLAISKHRQIPSLEKLDVSPSSYILGLLDAIGELKRSVYDDIRQNQMESGEKKFETMESLYTMLSSFAVYDNIVQGVKRKLDIARILIEDTRSTITEEVRRSEFMVAVKDLSDKLGGTPFAEQTKKRELATQIAIQEEGQNERIGQGPEELGSESDL